MLSVYPARAMRRWRRWRKSMHRAGPVHLRALRRTAAADDAGRQAGGHGRAGDDAGAVPAVPAHPHLRAPRLARPARLRPELRDSADGRRRRAPAAQVSGRRPDARRRVSGRTDRRPVRRRDRRRSWSACLRSATASGSRCPSPIGCGFAGGGLRELCPKEAIWHFSPFVFTSLPRRVWQMLRDAAGRLAGRAAARADRARTAAPEPRLPVERSPPAVLLLDAVSAVELAVDDDGGAARDRARGGDADQDLEQRAHRAPPAGTGEAAARGEDRVAGQSDQPAFPLQHADVDLVADPHAAGNGAHADHEAVGPAAAADEQHRPFRHAARGARLGRRISGHRSGTLRSAVEGDQRHQPGHAGRHRAEHDPAAAGRELDQARPRAKDRRRADHDPQRAARSPHDHRGAKTTGSG